MRVNATSIINHTSVMDLATKMNNCLWRIAPDADLALTLFHASRYLDGHARFTLRFVDLLGLGHDQHAGRHVSSHERSAQC